MSREVPVSQEVMSTELDELAATAFKMLHLVDTIVPRRVAYVELGIPCESESGEEKMAWIRAQVPGEIYVGIGDDEAWDFTAHLNRLGITIKDDE